MKTKALMIQTAATLIVAGGTVSAIPSLAHADLITVTAQETGDSLVTVGSGPSPFSFSGTVNDWTITGSALGTPPEPPGTIDSNTIDIENQGTGTTPTTLTIWISEQGLTNPLGTPTFLSSLTTNLLQNGVDSVTLSTFLDQSNNVAPPTGSLLDTATFTTSDTTQVSTKAQATGTGPYSLVEEYQIVAPPGATANLTIDLSTVPEPASIAIFGTALLGLGALRGWRRRKNG